MDNSLYLPLKDEQRRILSDAISLHEAQLSLERAAQHYRGSMSWKFVHGKEYLYRANGKNRQSSLGPRATDTERLYQQFTEGRAAAKAQLAAMNATCALQAKYVIANGLGRLPSVAGGVIEAMIEHGYAFRVVGTNALYGYETMAGVQFLRQATATLDMDLLFDGRRGLRVMRHTEIPARQLLAVLQQVDSSFRRVQSFRAVNSTGYMVDVITSLRDWARANRHTQTAPDDLQLVEIAHLDWLANAPAISATAFTLAGKPVRFDTPDPRFFAVHKVFLSHQPNRDPIKKQRDLMQARVVAALINEHLPWLNFSDRALQVFPLEVRRRAAAVLGFDIGM
jgi:hypothetical protein